MVGRCHQENGDRCGRGCPRCVSSGERALERSHADEPNPACVLERLWDVEAVDRSLGEIVPRLLKRFASREGYKLFDDTLPTRTCSTLPALCALLGL